jgi:hypothetical protein
MWTTTYVLLTESEISVIQGCPLAELFLKPMIYSGLQIPAGIRLAFVSLFVI